MGAWRGEGGLSLRTRRRRRGQKSGRPGEARSTSGGPDPGGPAGGLESRGRRTRPARRGAARKRRAGCRLPQITYCGRKEEMTEMELLIDFHVHADRQGPGSEEETRRALSLSGVSGTREEKIADIGCGTGGQTITLARNTEAHITAVDIFPEFLDRLNSRAQELGLEERIDTLQESMDSLSFADRQFDLIWSEGAVYNIGFRKGVEQWSRFLKPGGCMALSEITWLTASRPKELEDFWNEEYPEIDTASNKIRVLEEAGFTPLGYFPLSQAAWLENYFAPMEKRFSAFLERHEGSEGALRLVEEQKEEIRMYRTYKDYFGYGFYIAKKLPRGMGA